MELALKENLTETTVKDYFQLLKPRVMSLVVFTGLVGMSLAPGHVHPFIAFLAILFIALGSGAAGAINMWYERELDAKMNRTKNRPIPAGRIPAESAFDFAVMCAIFSVFMMALMVNYLAAALLAGAILFYVFVYTIWLKPRTPMNIVIGGAAGALPPVIGWAAVTGTVTLEPIILFLITFMWTPPHFWALALVKSEDYARAGIPMLPTVAGRDVTVKQMVIYTLLLLLVSLLPYAIGMSGVVYLAGAALLGIVFIGYALCIYMEKNNDHAMPMFKYSLFYLSGIFTLLVADRALGL